MGVEWKLNENRFSVQQPVYGKRTVLCVPVDGTHLRNSV